MRLSDPRYLAEVQGPSKRFVMLLLMAAAVVTSTCLVVSLGAALVIPQVPVLALWGSVCVFATLSWVCIWMLIRLIRNVRATNGRTTMPIWFIQAFGLFLFVGITVAAVSSGELLLLVESLGVALVMLRIRSTIEAAESDANLSLQDE